MRKKKKKKKLGFFEQFEQKGRSDMLTLIGMSVAAGSAQQRAHTRKSYEAQDVNSCWRCGEACMIHQRA